MRQAPHDVKSLPILLERARNESCLKRKAKEREEKREREEEMNKRNKRQILCWGTLFSVYAREEALFSRPHRTRFLWGGFSPLRAPALSSVRVPASPAAPLLHFCLRLVPVAWRVRTKVEKKGEKEIEERERVKRGKMNQSYGSVNPTKFSKETQKGNEWFFVLTFWLF